MFELTTSNLDQEIREQKIADGLRRRELLGSPKAAAIPETAIVPARSTGRAPATRRATAAQR